MDGVGHLPGHRLAPAPGEVEIGDCVKEQPRIGMLRLVEEGSLGGHLAEPTQVHDPYMIRDMIHHRQVMADE